MGLKQRNKFKEGNSSNIPSVMLFFRHILPAIILRLNLQAVFCLSFATTYKRMHVPLPLYSKRIIILPNSLLFCQPNHLSLQCWLSLSLYCTVRTTLTPSSNPRRRFTKKSWPKGLSISFLLLSNQKKKSEKGRTMPPKLQHLVQIIST